ncbi:hypothetical protein ABB37_04327 [Leptomonas pyrrhocoris]|uniref:Uncharacterized protein n=1 Tax=Leptomonas pyrrhocoris TaxID=157538 RepID=A0A0M9G2K2_LEPPY|nr:hypothetical protein ABB37_04327 [Leptomonas pyrrhocoris]KPA80927.1 hypothetical protein ABB37_04327 [Leptomonas pyrrhocoris]|eukprot:XP_015659366.1 hypothetical protein ABB37_04327 [Leptomonas pyrrhocoris]
MKRFSRRAAPINAGRRAVAAALRMDAAATTQLQHSSASMTFFSALQQSCACYSSQTSKAFSGSKARAGARAAAAPAPGATAQMPSPATTATKPTGSRSSGGPGAATAAAGSSSAKRKGGGPLAVEASSSAKQGLPTSAPGRRHRRTASAQLTDFAGEPQVKPMRSRRSSEQPRKRRNTRQKASLLLQAHEEQARAGSAAASSASPSLAATTVTPGACGGEGNSASSNEEGAALAFSGTSSSLTQPSFASEGDRKKTNVAALTTDELLSRVQLASFVERVLAQVRDWAASLAEWTRPFSDPTLREWERQLLLSLRRDSFSDCSAVQYAMQQRYEDHFGSSSHDVAFLSLYARVLVNNAVFCLLNFVTYRATELLTEALQVAQRAYTLQLQSKQRGEDQLSKGSEIRKCQSRKLEGSGTTRNSTSSIAKSAKQDHGVHSFSSVLRPTEDPESHLVFLRVLLANAYASDQQYWKAAEQYQLVLFFLELNPLWSADQLTPGLGSSLALNRTFVEEDAKLFYSDAARVDRAASQGTAQLLLLQSQGMGPSTVPLMHVQLAMARLHRHAGRYAESQSFYESYLDGAAEHMEGEDVAAVMVELGRLLLYKERNEDAALIYLEAGANILLEDAQDLLQSAADAAAVAAEPAEDDGGAAVRIAAGNAAQRAAGGLIDTAMAFHAQGKTGKAIGLLEGCLQLLDAAGLRLISGWVREQYADMLATVSLVDRALDEYACACDMLLNECHDAVEQLGAGGQLVSLSASEVEGHLAFCLQTYVGDHKRAMAHYRNVVQRTYRASPLVKSAQAKLSKRARRQRAAASSSSLSADAGRGMEGRVRAAAGSSSNGSSSVGASALSPVHLALKPDTLHWVLSNYVACCERVGEFAEAIGVQNRLIEIEAALGGNVVDSYVKLISLQQQSGEVEKTLALCFYVFYLPDAMMAPHTRLEVANCFASSCHQLGNNRMGAVLMQAVQHVRGDHDANALVHYAMCLKSLDPADRLQLDGMMDIEASIQSIGCVFRRAASIVVSDTVMDRVEEETTVNATTSSSCPTSLWTRERVERALNGLIVLSRGAFFFHQNRFMKDAADLYAHALEQVNHITAAMPVLTDALQREMGILLVNYATLKAADDATQAAALYERAAELCSSYLEVAEVVADFFVKSGDYAKGSVYMKRVLSANPASAAEMHLRLARLGTGPAWDTMSHGQRLEVIEHLLKGLGVSAERVAAAMAMMMQRRLGSDDTDATIALTDITQLLMDGVATAMSEEAVCLATYIVQTRFQEPQLLNRMYRRALLRFPQHATILVNYATLCMYSGYHVLARKYIAKAYAASSGDLNCTMCYAHYLCRSYEDQQIGCGESLYSNFLETRPNSAPAHAAFANFMAGAMPTPFTTEAHFKRALELSPRSEDIVLQYGQFMWACTDSKNVYTNDEVRRCVFDRAEQLFKEAVTINPSSFTACHQLGIFYANRHSRFEEAMTMLYRAHKLQPSNVEVLRHILNTMHAECVRVQREEQRQSGMVAGQGGASASTPTSRLRALTAATKDMFENVVCREPDDRATLERYARFAVETLKDPHLAASLYSRIQELQRK